jgi:hypothetical protein
MVGKSRKGGRHIDESEKHTVEFIGTTDLRKRLKEGASVTAERDLEIAREWFFAEYNPWEQPPAEG